MNFLPATLEGDTLTLPFGPTQLPEELASRLESAGKCDVIAGIRPEHFEDATVADEHQLGGMRFTITIDVVESMGSEHYAYFDVEAQAHASDDLAELAEDAGLNELPGDGATHVVARLSSESRADAGHPVELVLDLSQIKLFDPDGGRNLTTRRTKTPAGASR